ncbi:MAG: radical SAM protein [bacterium]|nr:radical SAM protein [bacterium]
MNNIFNKLKLKWFIVRKSFGYTEDYLKRVYKIYLNHNKIIHYRDGCPVCSLSTPAIFSKPAANMFARSIFSSIQNRRFPNLMSYAVNDTCNANCKHCSFFGEVDRIDRKVLNFEESQSLIKQAQDLGVSVINFVGGEPLLREDLHKIISTVDKTLSTTVVFTNGSFLAKKAASLKVSGLDSVYVSIDSSDENVYDAKRGKKGLFQQAISGIKEAKRVGLSTGISCCISKEEFNNGDLKNIIELGKKIGVHEIVVFDKMPSGRVKGCGEFIDDNGWIKDLIEFTKKYNDDESYPGILVYAYATSYKSTGCSGGTSYFYVTPYGDISPCDFNHITFGNILEKPLFQIWEKLSESNVFNKASWNGCKIKDSAYLNSV